MISFKDLIAAGVHFGHQKSRWRPEMAPYIWGFKNNVHLIDISKTAYQLEKAAKFLETVVANGKNVMWVGTKKAAQVPVKTVALSLNQPYVTHRWIGGTLTNFSQVKKSVTKLLHLEDIVAKTGQFSYTKKELITFKKGVDRLEANIGGIKKFAWPLGALVVVDVRKEQAAIKEAAVRGIPVVALVDTNSDPSRIDYVIPANDDSQKSIALILNYLAEAVKRGQIIAKEKPAPEKTTADKVVVLKKGAKSVPSKVEGSTPAKKIVVKAFGSAKPVEAKSVAKAAAPKVEAKKPVEKKAAKPAPEKKTSK